MVSRQMMENEYLIFRGKLAPEYGTLTGYAAIVAYLDTFYMKLFPAPRVISIISQKDKRRYQKENWQVFPVQSKPAEGLFHHLVFAIKYEGIDLFLIKKLFESLDISVVKKFLELEPTSQYSRRIWFLYEWLTAKMIDLPDLTQGNYVELVNRSIQFSGPTTNSKRHRIKNNLPGTREFCPMIFRTEKIQNYIKEDLSSQVIKGLKNQDRDLIRRTAAFLLLKDSKASFAIEGEYPPNLRAKNWGIAIGQAGRTSLTLHEIERLQDIIIGPKKLKNMGIRTSEGFIGEHDRDTFMPIPDHISAKKDDLEFLLAGLIDTNELLKKSDYHPVLSAATIAFGFVFIHPLVDGNGRLHRYLIHHLLAETGFTHKELIFPVSAAILQNIVEYQQVLETYSLPRLALIDWETTHDHNVAILNDTIDLYRYYDLTPQTEFLFDCIKDTIVRIIPEEIEYLKKYDQFFQFINTVVSLPNTRVDLLIKLMNQGEGKLSKKKRAKEFSELTEEELHSIEAYYQEVYH